MSHIELPLQVEISIRWAIDESPHTDHLGKFTGTWEEGAIECSKHDDRWRSDMFRWFVSFNYNKHDSKNWEHVSGKDKRDLIKKHGSLKNVTRFYALEDFKRMQGLQAGEWHYQGCIVTVRLGQLETEESVWGIESDCDAKHKTDMEREVIEEAIISLKESVMARLEVK